MKYLRQSAEISTAANSDNLYGPTETNVCTYYKVERERLAGMENLPIGNRLRQYRHVFGYARRLSSSAVR